MSKLALTSLLILTISLSAIEIKPFVIESSKLNENDFDFAQSLELLDRKKMDIYHIKDIKDLSSTVPNTNISGLGSPTNRTFTFRGISNYIAYESSVAMYVDDVPVPFSFGYGVIDMNNVAKIEVLKGPQGTQFGKGAESGVINVYTKPTTKSLTSELSLDLGTYNSKSFYGRISGPMSNRDFTYALSASRTSRDGFSKNTQTGEKIDDRELTSFSTKLRYNPNSSWDVTLNYSKNILDDGGSAFKTDTKDNPFEISDKPYDDTVKMDNDLLSLGVKYKQGDYDFISSTTYAKQDILKKTYANSLGGLLIDLDVEIEEVTQEVRMKYSSEDIDFLVGAFYSDKTTFDYKENIYSFYLKQDSTNMLKNPDRNFAVFTQMKYWINEHYSLSAGVRYQNTKRSFNRKMNEMLKPTYETESSTDWNHILPMLSFSYCANDDSHTYFRYSKGYRPGGYNYRAPGTTLVPFEPETVESFELGHKQKISSKLSINGNIFYNDITNHRTVTFDNNLATTTLNANKAYSYGAELDLSYQTDNLLIYSNIGIIQAKFKDFKNSGNSYDGNNLLDVPNMTAALGATYSFNNSWFVEPSLKYMGKRYYDIENTKAEDGYTIVDLNLGYKNLDGWKAVTYMSNIFDQRSVNFLIHTPTHDYYQFCDPKVFGVKISKTF